MVVGVGIDDVPQRARDLPLAEIALAEVFTFGRVEIYRCFDISSEDIACYLRTNTTWIIIRSIDVPCGIGLVGLVIAAATGCGEKMGPSFRVLHVWTTLRTN